MRHEPSTDGERDAGRRSREASRCRSSASRSKARSYALVGALLSQGAPIGALVLQVTANGWASVAQVGEQKLLYAYMSVATDIAFSLFGYILGSAADNLILQRGELCHANHRLKWLSEVDPLTGVLNRRAMQARLQGEFKRAQRDGSSVALLMLDLDHFKRVNDTFGHVAGDRVLRRVGRHLRRTARATDSVGRLGGEEFLAVLPETGIAEARNLAERMRRAIGAPPVAHDTPQVTVSAGLLVVSRPDPNGIEESLRLADEALYRAKAGGRDRVCVSPASQDAGSAAGAPRS